MAYAYGSLESVEWTTGMDQWNGILKCPHPSVAARAEQQSEPGHTSGMLDGSDFSVGFLDKGKWHTQLLMVASLTSLVPLARLKRYNYICVTLHGRINSAATHFI